MIFTRLHGIPYVRTDGKWKPYQGADLGQIIDWYYNGKLG